MNKIPLFLLATAAALPLATAPASAVGIELVNRTALAGPMDGNGHVERIAALTPDGRHTLFSSSASNLVAGDTNRGADLFIHDATDGSIERVSVGTGGIEAQGSVGMIGAVSDDGRYVVFDSDANDLVATPTHGLRQIYLRDRSTGTTTLLTRLNSGAAAVADSANPQLSADGRHVVFDSAAAFDANDTNGQRDIYRLDRQSGEFELISVSADGRVGNADSYQPQISADGSAVVFYTWASNLVADDTNNYWDLLLRKPAAGTMQRVSRKADGSQLASYPQLPLSYALSGDGRHVAFNAYESLVADDTNDAYDGYRYDSQNDTLERVTIGTGGQIGYGAAVSALSRDGQRVLMQSNGAGIVAGQPSGNSRVFQRELVSGAITHVTFRAGAEQVGDDAYGSFMSDDASVVVATTTNGRFLVGDNNNMTDVLRQDGRDSAATRVSAPSASVSFAAANNDSGDWSGFAASADQRYVVFGSRASNLVVGDTNGADDIFVRDRLLGTNERVSVSTAGSEGFCGSTNADISADGRYVVFHSCSPLAQAPPFLRMDVYRHDRLTHTTEAVSLTPQGAMPNSYSVYPSISDDGRYVAFSSCATDLVANDTNLHCDVFVRDMQAGSTVLASRSHDGLGANEETFQAKISGDGSAVAFASWATNLVAGDSNEVGDVFVFDRGPQTLTRVSVSSLGAQADRESYFHDLSRDGRQVLFTSFAGNFGVPVPFAGLYVHDRDSGATELVSRTSSGDALGGNLNTAAISGDGQRVAFTADGGDAGFGYGLKLVLFERAHARLGLVLAMDIYQGPRGGLRLDDDGSHLLLASGDNRLVDDDANNQFSDVFLLDRLSDYLFDDNFEPTP